MCKPQQWKDVAGYEGLYQVSDGGELRKKATGELLKVYFSPNGYARAILRKNARRNTVSVHRAVALTFIPNTENKPCVNHIDGNKRNNTVSNLEWCTYSENELHSHRVLGKKTDPEHMKRIIARHVEVVRKPVEQFSMDGVKIGCFASTAEAYRVTGISQGNISECCNHKRKQAGGYIWNFAI